MNRPVIILLIIGMFFSSGCMKSHVRMYNQGIDAFEQEEYATAVDFFHRVQMKKSTFSDAYYAAGLALYKLGRFEDALMELNRVAEVKKNDPDYFMTLGLIQYAMNQKELALVSFKKSYEMSPTQDHAFNLGIVLRELGQMERALPIFQVLLKEHPDSFEILENTALCLKSVGRHQEADALFRQAGLLAEDEAQKQRILSFVSQPAKIERDGKEGGNQSIEIVIYSPPDGAITFEEDARVEAKIFADAGIQEAQIFVNGTQFHYQRGMDIQPANELKKTNLIDTHVPLQDGDNQILFSAKDRDGRISTETIRVVRNKPKLFGLFIGLGKYEDPGIPALNYAQNDAAQLFDFFSKQTAFDAPQLRLLVDEQATRANITEGLAYFLSKAAPHDLAIIFLAGHGIQEAGEYFFIPYDAVKSNLFGTAIKDVEFESSMKRISARRLILITDTCHSGGILTTTRNRGSEEGMQNFLSKLTKSAGRITISASEFDEVSLEDSRLQHGVFSYYLLQGLKGEADGNKDQLVGVMELYRYISEKIPDVTRGAQHPVLLVPDGKITGEVPIAEWK